MRKTVGTLLLLFVCGVLTGCSEGGPETVPVKGTLTIDGKPAEGVSVTLVPVEGSKESATGEVKNGNFEVYSGVEGKPGAVPGKYKVVLNATTGGTGEDAMNAYKMDSSGKRTSEAPQIKAPFPDKYKDSKTSDKEVEVTSGENNLKIDITS